MPPTQPSGRKLRGSQGSIPGSKNTSLNELRTKLSRASELERKLETLPSTKSPSGGEQLSSKEAKASEIRTKLCELYGDVLLSDPDFSLRRDVSGRIWRNCFYGRIAELRLRIGKERGRARRCQAKRDVNGAAKHEKIADNAEVNLKNTLAEAVAFYDYLVEKYQSILCGGDAQGQSQSQLTMSQESTGSMGDTKRRLFDPNGLVNSSPQPRQPNQSKSDPPHVTAGCMPILYKLLINLGDLLRYASNSSAASANYLKASKLAPGRGNPYNQLAVVAQMSEQTLTAVALYWYARSIQAMDEPFVTSRSNMSRLFLANRQWIDKCDRGKGTARDTFGGSADGGDEVSTLLSMDSKASGRSGKKKAQIEAARAAKSAASRRFLAEFVDLHWDLYRMANSEQQQQLGEEPTITPTVSNIAKSREEGWTPAPSEYLISMKAVIKSFSSLLGVGAFSDSLLARLVCINAFSYCNAHSGRSQKGSNTALPSRVLSATLTFSFGATLADHLEHSLDKVKQNLGEDKKEQIVIRSLSPFVILCDLASSFYGGPLASSSEPGAPNMILPSSLRRLESSEGNGGLDKAISSNFFEAEKEFWNGVAQIASQLQNVEAFSSITRIPKRGIRDLATLAPPMEYNLLRGYGPFAGIFPRRDEEASSKMCDSSEDENKRASVHSAFVTPREAVVALDLGEIRILPSQLTVETDQSSKISKSTNSVSEVNARVARFFAIVERHSIDPECGTGRLEGGKYLIRDEMDGLVTSMFKRVPTSLLVVGDDECGDDDGSSEHALVFSEINEGPQGAVESTPKEKINMTASPECKGDLLVYKKSAGKGPPLLVPSQLLLDTGSAGGTDSLVHPATTMAPRVHNEPIPLAMDVDVPKGARQAPPASALPPPGFAAATVPAFVSEAKPVAEPTLPLSDRTRSPSLTPCIQLSGRGSLQPQQTVPPGFGEPHEIDVNEGLFGEQFSLRTANPFSVNIARPQHKFQHFSLVPTSANVGLGGSAGANFSERSVFGGGSSGLGMFGSYKDILQFDGEAEHQNASQMADVSMRVSAEGVQPPTGNPFAI